MSNTYRALAIVAVVAVVATAVSQFAFTQVLGTGSWFAYAPIIPSPTGLLPLAFILPLWTLTNTLAAPIVGVFGVIVAAQARRWGWLVALTLLGLLAVYGPTLLGALGPYIDSAVGFRAMGLIESVYVRALPLTMLAIAALIFVATARRRHPQAAVERVTAP